MEKLQTRNLDGSQKELVHVLGTHLKEFASGFKKGLTQNEFSIMPTELKVGISFAREEPQRRSPISSTVPREP